MGQNGAVARPESPRPRRGLRGRRTWVTVDEGRPQAAHERPGTERPDTVRSGTVPSDEVPSDTVRSDTGRSDAGRSDTGRYVPRRRYPWHDDPDYDPAAHRRTPPPRTWTPPPAAAAAEPEPAPPPRQPPEPPEPPTTRRMPRKLTVTRVAALRSRELTEGGIRAFRRATTADGADRSGLAALTYATMMSYAIDAAVAVALANTLFFAAATAESKTNVALYLIITVAPFAVVAPVIGPMLDRLQRGRRAALAVSCFGRAALAVVMAFNYENWLLYPAALGAMVLSKSFAVLKAAVTPRVLPSAITLVTTNSRLTTFGLVAGGVAGAVAAGVAWLWDSPGALFFTAVLGVAGTVLCLRIPRWVESTAGEVAATLRTTARGRRTPMGRRVTVALWGNGAVRVLTGFLVVREQSETDPAWQVFLIGLVGAAAGLGSFTGNAVGSRRQFLRSDAVIMSCVTAAVVVSTVAALLPGIATAALVGLIGAAASALAKVCLDAVIQRDLPEESRASAFGRSETVLALAWVLGGAIGVLLPHDTFWLGFAVIATVIALAGVQSALVARGRSLLPFLGHRAPQAG